MWDFIPINHLPGQWVSWPDGSLLDQHKPSWGHKDCHWSALGHHGFFHGLLKDKEDKSYEGNASVHSRLLVTAARAVDSWWPHDPGRVSTALQITATGLWEVLQHLVSQSHNQTELAEVYFYPYGSWYWGNPHTGCNPDNIRQGISSHGLHGIFLSPKNKLCGGKIELAQYHCCHQGMHEDKRQGHEEQHDSFTRGINLTSMLTCRIGSLWVTWFTQIQGPGIHYSTRWQHLHYLLSEGSLCREGIEGFYQFRLAIQAVCSCLHSSLQSLTLKLYIPEIYIFSFTCAM